LKPGVSQLQRLSLDSSSASVQVRVSREVQASWGAIMAGAVTSGTPGVDPTSIAIPAGGGGVLLEPGLPGLAARLGARLLDKPVRVGGSVIAVRHRDVTEVLRRDLDFVIAPVNAARIAEVNGPFILGMDRSDQLTRERHALYAALAEVDIGALMQDAGARADAILAEASGDIDAVGGYARLVAGGTAQRLFGVTGPDQSTYLDVARAIFAHTFLNLNGDKAIQARALQAAVLMRAWLSDEIARRRHAGVTGDDLMGAMMRRGELDDDGIRRTLGGMLVGAVDTTASATAKIVVMLGRDPALAARVTRDAGDPQAMLGWCRDVLRRWPHNPIVMRQAATDTTLAGVAVPAGARVIAWTQAAMFDEEAFPDATRMRPDRPADAYLHFGGGLHPCAGRAINDRQIPMLVGKLLARGLSKIGALGWAGPFPARLPVTLGKT
jgi:cytochrome P450